MRKLYFLSALCALFLIINSHVYATDQVTIGEGETPITSYSLPISINATSESSTGAYYSISQQIYLASELGSGTAKKISAVKFQYVGASNLSRNLEVYLMETNLSAFPSSSFIANANDEAGDKVFDGAVSLTASSDVTIEFTDDFEWNGSKNIVLTIYDKTGRKDYPRNGFNIFATPAEGGNRFGFKRCSAAVMNVFNGWSMDAVSSINADSQSNYKYANIITFIFADENPEPPATPTNFSVSAVSLNSATLSWSSSYSATSYDLEQSADGETWSNLSLGETGTSYNWTGLSTASTQYARIRANNAIGSSDWSDAVTVTTDAVHSHDGITFTKWASTNSLPAEAGNYYLNADVTLSTNYTVPGNINLCLNGHSIYTYAYYITVSDNKTLAVYDNVGGGRIYGYYTVELEFSNNGLITVDADGTLILNGVSVENLANQFNDGEAAYGIYSIGTLKISGASVISGYDADIHLYDGKVITIEEGKPLANTTPYRILRGNTGDITSGWANMNGANPSDYLTSAPPARGVCLNSTTGEARYVRRLRVDENEDNDDISEAVYASQLINVSITRSVLTSASYNTICLPFALSNAQLEDVFGSGYDLEEFESSSLDGEVLSLTFNQVDALEAGKPYLLKPANNVTNPSFEGVTISATSPADQTSDTYISVHGTYRPTELAGGNKNLLFLGADNTLFWPESTGDIKGFRAYFEVKGDARKAVRARIVKGEEADQALEMTNDQSQMTHKVLRYGQLIIERNGKTYNAQGQLIK